MLRKILLTSAILTLGVMPAMAGPYTDFEAQLREAYAAYRAALFQTNMKDAEKTNMAMKAFAGKWDAIRQTWSTSQPPQYADDPAFMATLDKVAAIAGAAAQEVAAGKLAEAHEVLEAIRDEVGDLRLRNGLYGFSDRINAYHAEMEEVLSADYASMGDGALGDLRAKAAVLSYLAADIAAHPAPEKDDPAYAPLVDGLLGSVDALTKAVEAGDLDAALKAVKMLKKPFSMLFVKFG